MLAREGIGFDVRETTQPAESRPLRLLAKIRAMKDGGIAVIDSGGAPAVVGVVRSLPAPLARREAAPTIERFLASRRRGELAREEIARFASRAVPVNAAIRTTYDPSTNPMLAAHGAVAGKDERS